MIKSPNTHYTITVLFIEDCKLNHNKGIREPKRNWSLPQWTKKWKENPSYFANAKDLTRGISMSGIQKRSPASFPTRELSQSLCPTKNQYNIRQKDSPKNRPKLSLKLNTSTIKTLPRVSPPPVLQTGTSSLIRFPKTNP